MRYPGLTSIRRIWRWMRMGSPFKTEAEAKTAGKVLVVGSDAWCQGQGTVREARATEANMGALDRTGTDERVWQRMWGGNATNFGR